jgi:hypothetical protein
MLRLSFATACVAAVVLGAGSASAQPLSAPNYSASLSDARCLLAMVALTHAKNPAAARTGSAGVLFFTGRLSAGASGYDFSRLRLIASGLDPKQVQAELQQRCVPLFSRTMAQVQSALAPRPKPPEAMPPLAPPPEGPPAPPGQ